MSFLEKRYVMESKNAKENVERVAVFAGSFDPYTIGHDDIVRRALRLFDRIVIVVARNPEKKYMFTTEERVEAIRKLYRDERRVSVMAYGGMIVDIAAEVGARFQVRGVRTAMDFEYERVEAEYNDKLGGLETVLLYSKPQFSTFHRQLTARSCIFTRMRKREKCCPCHVRLSTFYTILYDYLQCRRRENAEDSSPRHHGVD